MQRNIYQYLSNYSDDPQLVDSLITSAFIRTNQLVTRNAFVNTYLIDDDSAQNEILLGFLDVITKHYGNQELDFEHLIELFEFVVSPAEKIINGAVYTPANIRKYIVNRVLQNAELGDEYRLADISCGCGGFLLTAADQIKRRTGRTFERIFRDNIFGVDITGYSIDRSKILLTLLAIMQGEDMPEFEFNLFIGDSLSFDWVEALDIPDFQGFNAVVGNPPYVASRNMEDTTIALLDRWSVATTGHPDLYIPFFQIGYEALKPDGILGLITVNTFIKSINGRALRAYFAEHSVALEMINFGGEQVFRDRNTYTCICFIGNFEPAGIKYIRCQSNELSQVTPAKFLHFSYDVLNHFDGWNLFDNVNVRDFVAQVENTGTPFKNLFNTKNGIATLMNDVYKFKPIAQNDNLYTFVNYGVTYQIEQGICKNIINANRIHSEDDLVSRVEKIIFPYIERNGSLEILSECDMSDNFPLAYQYLTNFKQVLATRDKGKKTYEAWYAYGRRQSMDKYEAKLFFPHICDRPRFVLSNDPDLLFYNGIAVVADDPDELLILKKLLESHLFYLYIRSTTKDYASGYISLSRNYLKNFGIYPFTEEERIAFLASDDPDTFLAERYNVTYFE